jgi:polar amino acid transport system substrate-binding protein
MTEEYPPYNMTKEGKLTGISVEVLELVLQEVGSKKAVADIQVLPWARSYSIVQNKKNTMLFSMFRTKQRENLFQWVGPIDSSKIALIGKKERKIKIDDVSDMKKYKIGTVKDDVAELTLKELGVTSFDSISGTNSIETSIKKLDRNRIDLFAYVYETKSWKIDNFQPEDYENVYTLKKNDLYFAFHKETDPKLVKELQKVLDRLKKQGMVQKIISKYK